VTKRYNRNSSSFDIGSFNSAREKFEQMIATNTCLRSTIHLFIKLCSRWNVLGRGRGQVEKLCPIQSGYGHMNGPSTTILPLSRVALHSPRKKKFLLTICQTVYRSLPHFDYHSLVCTRTLASKKYQCKSESKNCAECKSEGSIRAGPI